MSRSTVSTVPVYRWVRLAAGHYLLRLWHANGAGSTTPARVYRLDTGGWRACWSHDDDLTISEAHTLYEVQRAAELAALPEGAERAR